MKLKADINLELFFEQVRKCRHNVYFQSEEDDQLNLNSALCFYVFTAAFLGKGPKLQGNIICETKDDEMLLKDFLQR